MSFGWTAAIWEGITAAAAVAGVAVSVDASQKARSQQNKAQDAAKANALENQKQADEANNRANAKSPDSAAMMAANVLAGRAGQGSTMLTGPQGVDPSSLTLGKSTLLGG